jgi:hypothetical protein
MRSALFLICLLLASFVSGQQSVLRGFVYESESGEPVIFTNVYFKGTTLGAATDVNGFYSITQIPPGSYTLMVTYMGYDTLTQEISLKAGEIRSLNLTLKKSSINLKTFEVTARSEESKTEVRVSVNKITPKEVKQIPTIGGQPDLAQYLQVLPGVVFTGDQGGQLYIRGGAPIQNKVLLDGMVIYNPFHSIGLFSVFDMDIIRNADVYTGGFNAQYGGRISSIMDLTTRDGNKKRTSGKVGVSPFGLTTLLEGPIVKACDTCYGSTSYLISAKNSYLSQTSKILYEYVDPAGLPFDYLDLYGKVSMNASNGSKLNVFGFNFDDQVNYKALTDYHWKSSGVGTSFVLVPGSSPVLFEGNFSWSRYFIQMTEGEMLPRTSEINGFNSGFNFSYFYGKQALSYGFEVLGFRTDFDFYNAVGRKIEQEDNTTEIAAYIKGKLILGKLLLEPGFRLHYYASLDNSSPEPRLGAKYLITDFLRFKLSAGMYSQNFLSATSDRDVVNLFYGFLSGPENLQTTFNGKEITHKLQKANHAIAGFEIDLGKHIELNLEGYFKDFTQLTNINRNKVFNDDGLKDPYFSKDFIIETGTAKGVDFSIRFDSKAIYFWGVYSLGYVDRYDSKMSYVPHYDRRHNVNLLGSYSFGKGINQWEINVRWNFGSGFPFTQTQGIYELIDFSSGINTDYTTANGELGYIYADLNQGRLPYYHRLDMTLKKSFLLTEKSKLEAALSVTNAYNRENIFYFNRTTYERVNQLPILPSFSLTFTF